MRGHRGVESSLNWVLDVMFGDDDSHARSGCAAENRAATGRLADNPLRRHSTYKRRIKSKFQRTAIDPITSNSSSKPEICQPC